MQSFLNFFREVPVAGILLIISAIIGIIYTVLTFIPGFYQDDDEQ